nr:carboxypeptidase regulatory-like domain-containing protein [Paenibacillus xylanexedens]
MKQRRNVGKPLLSLFLAIMLVMQTVMFSTAAYAESVPNDTEVEAVSEPNSPIVDEPSEETVNDPDSPIVDESSSGSEEVQDAPEQSLMMAAVPMDKTSVFMESNVSFPLELKQGNVVIDLNGIIQGRKPFTLKSEGLKVPVNGDDSNPTNADPEKYIQKGDWIELKREDHFKEVVLPTATRTLYAQTDSGTKQLGTTYFTPNSIRVVFDGDDNFFNGVGRGVTFSFETTADADVTGLNYGDKKPVNIFGSTYQLENPNVTAEYGITLTSPGMIRWDQYSYRGLQPAQFVEGAITWQSTVSASDQFDKTIKLPLDGKTFYTNPSAYNTGFGNSRGIYVEGSFKVNDQNVTPVVGTDGSLTYIFPSGTGPEPKVEYKTWIPKESYYYEYRNPPSNLGRSHRDTTGKVELRQDDSMLVQAGLEMSFAPDWIQSSASYDHASETITWKVTVNRYNKNGLKDFTITNVLPAGLNFVSAEWQEDGTESGLKPIIPDANGVYSFGNINGKVDLIIKSKVISGSSFRIDPRANWNLDTPAGIQNNDVTTGKWPVAVTDEAIVNIGAHNFTKSGAVSTEDYNQGSITWTVNLAPQYALPNAAVYDVLVHGGNLDVLDNAVDVTGEVSAETIAKIKANVTSAQLWKQYKAGTLKTSEANLTMKAIPLTVDGKVVADLIKVTGYTDSSASFSFRALETNPDILFRQDINVGKTSSNRALLIDGENVRQAQNNANLHLRMLNKDMLFASRPLKVDGTLENVSPNNVNSYIRNDSNDAWTISAYDRTTKTVTFRLGVNMPGYDTEEMAKDGGNRVVSNIKLVDTLPAGWEFVPFSEGKDYELWKGFSDNGSGTDYGTRNDAKNIIEPGTDAHVVSSFTHNDNVGTFTFSKLESPYVILVKARPSNEALEEYLNEYTTNGTDKQVVYNKADLHMSWGGVEKIVSEQRKIIVPIQTLGKSVTKPVPGVLEWTVNYTPPFNMKQGVYLEDTLGAGMNLRYEVNGKLVLTSPSMAVYPAKLTASGTLERGEALDLSDPNSEVQVEVAPGADGTTVLKFKMNNPNKFYQFVYQTEVDPSKAKAGDKMGNEVKLKGDDSLSAVSARSESTLDSSDVAGSSSSNALLPLIKVDPNGNPLKDVEFTLFKKDTGTIVVKGKTDSLGKRNLLFPDPGYYELKETYIDTNTWLPTTKIYQVYVGNTPGKPLWVDGVKVTSDQPLIVPTPAQGKLTITNKVEGNGSDQNKGFVYTVTFTGEGQDEEYVYKKSDNTSGTLKNGDKIVLKHGESAILPALPANLVYTVTEDDYTTVDGYTTTPDTRELSGSIVNKGDHKADFINERIVNKLTISNTVMGNGGDKTKEFEYIIRFEETGKDESYSYMKSDNSTGMIKSGDTFRLKDGETLDISGLPKHLRYTVSQKDYTTDEYMTTPEERYYSEVMKGMDEETPFTNVRVLKGGLLISNTVKGKDEDKSKLFKYTITFTGEGSDESYAYEKSDGSKGMIKNGDSFELTDGQTLIVQGLPSSLEYTVTQDDYTKDGYVTDPERFVRTGVIPEKKAAEAKFKNTRPYLEGVLRDNNTGEVIPNASITVTDLKTGEELQIKTNEKGEYAVPAVADTDYTITYTKLYRVGGRDVPVKFTQKANVNSSVTDETIPADITAVGIIMLKQMDGTTELFNSLHTSHMYIYLKDRDGNYITENGRPKAFPMASNGTFSVEGLSEQKYTMEVRYQVETGEELLLKVTQLDVKANGELNISEELVDPYGTVYDETTGNASTGKKIEGAKVTLYYADTQRNRDKGRIPGTKVTLPAVPNFPPHDNKSPEQDSDVNGFYAYMVFPEADYYLVVTKDGYETHTSGTISVDFDIVKYDVPMKPIRSGGGSGGNSGGNTGNSGTGNGTPGTNTGNSGTDPGIPGINNGTPETSNGNGGTDNGIPGTNNGTPGTNTDNSGTDNGVPGTDNSIPGTDAGNSGTNNGTPGTNNGNTGTNSGTPGTNTGNTGTNNGNGGATKGDQVTDNVSNELDDAPKTGDNSISPMFYMILALMSLITIAFCLLGNKKKKHI